MNKFMRTNLMIYFYLMIILKYPIYLRDDEKLRWINYCLEDFERFPSIFSNENNCCFTFLNDIHILSNIGSDINKMFGTRKLQYGIIHQHTKKKKIVIKRLAENELLEWIDNQIKTNENKNDIKLSLETALKNTDRFDRIQICPNGQYQRFVNKFKRSVSNELYLLMLLNLNSESIFLNELHAQGFPVPNVYTKCGLIFTQSFNGDSLYNFYDHPFGVRIFIAKQLLEAAIKFSYGTNDGFRIYLTDATPDNIVVNSTTYNVTFIDFNNIIVLDSLAKVSINNKSQLSSTWKLIHKHEQIDCDGCFAYVPKDLCEHHLSDINIFAICQLLKEDLHGNTMKGFLHSIPDDILKRFSNLTNILNNCMHCSDINNCDNRFNVATELLEIFDNILIN